MWQSCYKIQQVIKPLGMHQFLITQVHIGDVNYPTLVLRFKTWLYQVEMYTNEVTWHKVINRSSTYSRNWYALRKKFSYSELLWSAFFPHFPAFRLNIRSISPCSVRMRENSGKKWTRITPSSNAGICLKNADQNNSEYRHFLRSYIFERPSTIFTDVRKNNKWRHHSIFFKQRDYLVKVSSS